MSLTTVLTKVQQRVDDDKTALRIGSAGAADLPAAQAILDAITDVSTAAQAQSDAATARLTIATTAATAAADTTSSLHDALGAAPFSLTTTQEKKLTKAVTDAGYAADFTAVQTAMATLATDWLVAADAQADLAASRQKVSARVNVLSQWVAVAEKDFSAAGPLVQQATVGVGAGDLARAWWAITQANKYLTVVNASATTKAVTSAITDLKKQADDYAATLDAWLTADAAVAADLSNLASLQQALADKTKATAATLTALVDAGL